MATVRAKPAHARGAHLSVAVPRWRQQAARHARAAETREQREARRPYRVAIRVLIVALVVAVSLLGGTAYAYFSGTGAATGHAAVESWTAVTIAATAPTGTLFPGGTADLSARVTNPNPFPVVVTALSPGRGTVAVTGAAGCTADNATVAVVPKTGLGISLMPGTSTVHIATGAAMGTGSASACQDATFDLPIQLRLKP